MHSPTLATLLLLALTPSSVLAFGVNGGHCSGAAATGDWLRDGVCISTTDCTDAGGAFTVGACPLDPTDIKCCVIGFAPESGSTNPCGAPSWCDWTSNGCPGGAFHPGFCPGPANFQCCLF